ncbi:ankyrin [Melanomma pulvis-pyrius CBS 109.77]|uniref:Ankyrin n=1 Tax=Melanomma pulvis-pyrius CBS 109.77 TaxID=1314802 RepID=A0A6A6XM24_9PLEO|nr:ankyrin [Melanomma pulvis-pyrius CBS 109.77]
MFSGDYRSLDPSRKAKLAPHRVQRETSDWEPHCSPRAISKWHLKATQEDVRRSCIMVAIIMEWPALLEMSIFTPAFQIIRFRYRYFGTPVETAISLGIMSSMRILLAHGVKIEPRWRSILRAAMRNDAEMIHTLLDHDISVPGYSGMWGSVAELCAQHGRWEIVQLLLRRGHCKERIQMLKILCYAAEQNNLEFAKDLISAGAPTTALPTSRWDSPLRSAVQKGHMEMAQLLLEHGAGQDINQRYVTPLMAVKGPNVERGLAATYAIDEKWGHTVVASGAECPLD